MLQFAQIDMHCVLQLGRFSTDSQYMGLNGVRERMMSSPRCGGWGRRGGASIGRIPSLSPWRP